MKGLVKSALCCAALLMLGGCAAPRDESKAVPETLQKYVLDQRPANMQHERFIDFGGKVHLIGYDAEPTDRVLPGGELKVTYYWKSVGELGPDWELFTHVLNDRGQRITPPPADPQVPYDDRGPLRERAGPQRRGPQALPPSRWVPGRYYVDEQTLPIPSATQALLTPRITLLIGVWNGPMRLEVLSGPAVEEAGIVAHFETGIKRPAPQPPKTASKTP